MVSRRLRYEIIRRDDHACRYCGARAPEVKLTVDHVMPTALGGSDEPDNLVTACWDCNAGKSSVAPDSPIVENVSDDALRWAAAMREAAQLQAADLECREAYLARVDEMWRAANRYEIHYPRPEDWRDSAERFYESTLELEVIEYAIGVTMRQQTLAFDRRWRYFCGICWRRLNERQEMAAELLKAAA